MAPHKRTLGSTPATAKDPVYAPRRKKKTPANDQPLSASETAEARATLSALQTFLIGVREDLDDPPSPKQRKTRAELRESMGMLGRWVRDLDGGTHAERDRRWAFVYELIIDARSRRTTPTAAVVAAWPLLPPVYASSPKATALLARSIAEKKRKDWLARLAEAVWEVDRVKLDARALETTVRRYQKAERRMLLVDAD